jgi:TRAP transporter 4TM/12TM fusion protein
MDGNPTPTAAAAPVSPVHAVANGAYYLTAVLFFLYLFYYYWTAEGGPSLLALALVPVTFVLYTLDELRKGDFYPRLPLAASASIGAIYIGISLAVAIYMVVEYEAIGTVRAGIWNATDITMGSLMALLILEYTRRRHMPLFVLNVILILYAVYGFVVPGMFQHPGLSWERIATAMSVEMTTGVFSNLPQLALTLIGSFIMVLAILRAFGCVDSILRASKHIAVRSPHALPQSAVIGSMAVGTVSGSGAANAITVGSATIPAMIGAGMPRPVASAIETASSLGGQLMPPIMGIAAFLMAEFLGRSYFDVVARGYAPAIIFYVSVSVSAYLLSTRYRAGFGGVTAERMRWTDWTNMAAFVAVVGGLIAVMAVLHLPPMFAALYVFVGVGGALMLSHAIAVARAPDRPWGSLVQTGGRFVDFFAEMTADLTLLLATLSIMTGALVITGVPTKVGSLLIAAAGVNLAAMVIVAFFFGALLGMGLPPAPTYIITALVIAPPIIKVGVDPWVVHFFAFFVAVWGEVTPPTSISAAITAKIANTSFMWTLWHAVLICIGLFMLMAGVFTRPELVLEPGLAQIGALILILTATIGVIFSIQAQFTARQALDIPVRLVLAAIAMVTLFHPDRQIAWFGCLLIGLFVLYWVLRRRASPIRATSGAA